MLTLRQIEIVRAVMISGSITGAARLLNVAQPGLSRTLKHVETLLQTKLFIKTGGRYVPSPAARQIFEQLQEINIKLEDLRYTIQSLKSGKNIELLIGSVPSLGNVMVPRAVSVLCSKHPDLRMNINILKLEEAIDYLLLGKSELVLMSDKVVHPSIRCDSLVSGSLVCIASPQHPVAKRTRISIDEIVRYPLIGIEPKDPYGRIIVQLFERNALKYDMKIKARFGSSVIALVRQNLGLGIVDVFTIADHDPNTLRVLPIVEPTGFETFVARRVDTDYSDFAQTFVTEIKRVMLAEANRKI